MDSMMRVRSTRTDGTGCRTWIGTVGQFVVYYPIDPSDEFGKTWRPSDLSSKHDIDTIFEIKFEQSWVEIPDPRYGYTPIDNVANSDLLVQIIGEEIVVRLPRADDELIHFVPSQRQVSGIVRREATPEEYYAHCAAQRQPDSLWIRLRDSAKKVSERVASMTH